MSLFVEFVNEMDEPLGPAFISYSRADKAAVHNIAASLFRHGLPYFLDERDIRGGSTIVEEIEKAVHRACVGVLVLSRNSFESPWVWFEAGLLIGFKRRVLPFVVNTDEPNDLIRELPDFIKSNRVLSDVNDLVHDVQQAQCTFYDLFDDLESNRRVVTSLRQVKLRLTLALSTGLLESVEFGILLVRFGREETLRDPANITLMEEGRLINRSQMAHSVHVDESSGEVEVKYILPIHRKLGLQFKPFVEARDLDALGKITEVLQAAGVQEVSRSHSVESQRVFFLLPESRLSVTRSPEGILNNFIYPE